MPPPGDLPEPETEPVSALSPESADGLFTSSATWEAHVCAQMHWESWQPPSLPDRRLGAGGSGGYIVAKLKLLCWKPH